MSARQAVVNNGVVWVPLALRGAEGAEQACLAALGVVQDLNASGAVAACGTRAVVGVRVGVGFGHCARAGPPGLPGRVSGRGAPTRRSVGSIDGGVYELVYELVYGLVNG